MLIPYKPTFDEAIIQLLNSASYSLFQGKKALVTFPAIENDNLIGIGSLWKNSIHPYRDYIGIYIHPDYRNKGIGKELFDQLSLASNTQKLQITIQSTDQHALFFYVSVVSNQLVNVTHQYLERLNLLPQKTRLFMEKLSHLRWCLKHIKGIPQRCN